MGPAVTITGQTDDAAEQPSNIAPTASDPSSPGDADGDDAAATGKNADEGDAGNAPEAPVAGGKTVVYGKIDGEINLAESAYVTRLLDRARLEEADVLLLELNTFGGRVDAAVAIRDALLDAEPETVVFINKRAISAGALISLACDKIAISPGSTIGAATPVTQSPGQEVPAAVEEKYLSYFRQELRVTAETKGRNGDIAEAMVDADMEIEGIIDEGKLLTLTTLTALEYGMADFEAKTTEDVLVGVGAAGVDMATVDRSWSETLVAFLTSAPIASLLLLGMMVGGYLEFQTPGFGIFGGVAILCFLLLYFSHYLVNLAGHEELLLFAIGVLLLVVEMFVFPGFGVAGVLGAAAVFSSMVMLLMAGDWGDLSLENPFTYDALSQISMVTLLAFGAMLLALRFLPHTPLGGGILLSQDLAVEEGYASHDAAPADLLGQEGTALSELRPSGKARIDGQRMDVETEGDWIEKGTAVKVVSKTEGRVVVRRA
ncbi:MAG: NfeD family protein [Acidobacteriota bacterium]